MTSMALKKKKGVLILCDRQKEADGSFSYFGQVFSHCHCPQRSFSFGRASPFNEGNENHITDDVLMASREYSV